MKNQGKISCNKVTGIYLCCDDTKRVIENINKFKSKDFAEVRISLDGTEKLFTLEDFKKRLDFSGGSMP
jgi:hypothetical protein